MKLTYRDYKDDNIEPGTYAASFAGCKEKTTAHGPALLWMFDLVAETGGRVFRYTGVEPTPGSAPMSVPITADRAM